MGSFWVYLFLLVAIFMGIGKIASKSIAFKKINAYVKLKKNEYRHNFFAQITGVLLALGWGLACLWVTIFFATYFPLTFLDKIVN